MSIGLYDDDFMRYAPVCFNLDLMKLSTYYKRKKEVVVLSPTLEPERYTHFIFRKDYNDGNFNKNIFLDNVEYGGHAFSGKKYISLPEEIQLVKPDKYIYEKLSSQYNTISIKNCYKTMTNAEHIRLSLNGTDIWKDFSKTYEITNKTRCVIFHDYDLGKIKDSDLIIRDITNTMIKAYGTNGQLVGMKFPVQIYNEQDFRKWLKFNPMSLMFGLQYNGLMNNDFFQEFLLNNNSRSISKNLYYNITYGLSSENDFIKSRLSKIFKQVLLSRSLGIRILLKYDDNFFIDKRWERIIYLFNLYCNDKKKEYQKKIIPGFRDFSTTYTLFRYISSPKFFNGHFKSQINWFTREEMRDLFQLVREKDYETFKMFYESCLVELKGGEIVDV